MPTMVGIAPELARGLGPRVGGRHLSAASVRARGNTGLLPDDTPAPAAHSQLFSFPFLVQREAFLARLDPGNFDGDGRQRTRPSDRTRPLLQQRG
jgi:hypothetical protein